MKNEFLSIQDAAKLLGVSPTTLRRWEQKGMLVPQRTMGNQRRYNRVELDNLKKKSSLPEILPETDETPNIQPVLASEEPTLSPAPIASHILTGFKLPEKQKKNFPGALMGGILACLKDLFLLRMQFQPSGKGWIILYKY